MDPTRATNNLYDKKTTGPRGGEWESVHRFLTGDNVEKELRKGVFESHPRYKTRQQMADFRPLTRSIIMRLVGMLLKEEPEVEDAGLIDEQWYRNAGLDGEDWPVIRFRLAETLLAYNRTGYGVKPGGVVEVIEPRSIPRWNSSGCIVKGVQDVSPGLGASEMQREVWMLHTPEGYQVWAQDDDKDKTPIQLTVRDYPITFRPNGPGSTPAAPYMMSPPLWQTALGEELTRTHRSVYQLRSAVDSGTVESISSSMIQAAVGDDESFATAFRDAMESEDIYIPYDDDLGEHKPLNIPTGPIEVGHEILQEKEASMYKTLGMYAAQVDNKSATEAAINARAGLDAVLTTLAASMADLEEAILRRVAIMQNAAKNGSRELLDINVTYPDSFLTNDNTGDNTNN